MDWGNFITALLVAIVSGVIANLGVWFQFRQSRKESQEKKQALEKAMVANRPELEILALQSVEDETGYTPLDMNTQPHIDAFIFYYGLCEIDKAKDESKWIHYDYTLRNAGKQSIYSIEIFGQMDGLMVLDKNQPVSKYDYIAKTTRFASYYRRRIHTGDTILLRVWYHKDFCDRDCDRNPITIVIKDYDGVYWEQPLNIPYDRLDGSKIMPPSERMKLRMQYIDRGK